VSNYLLGKQPAAFDILSLECGRHWHDGAVQPGLPQICRWESADSIRCDDGQGTSSIDISKLDFGSYVIGALRSHCPWPTVYRSAQMLGERCASSFWW
jgi:hypothetical protein